MSTITINIFLFGIISFLSHHGNGDCNLHRSLDIDIPSHCWSKSIGLVKISIQRQPHPSNNLQMQRMRNVQNDILFRPSYIWSANEWCDYLVYLCHQLFNKYGAFKQLFLSTLISSIITKYIWMYKYLRSQSASVTVRYCVIVNKWVVHRKDSK